MMKEREKGFSLIEILIVVAIIVIILLIAIPQIQRISAAFKIDAAGHSVAGLLQQARLQAVHDNSPAYAQYSATTKPPLAFVNKDGATAFATGNADVALSAGLNFQTA
jgi:prepilin-type N-terminal cleavage/methylation domain-containing protein